MIGLTFKAIRFIRRVINRVTGLFHFKLYLLTKKIKVKNPEINGKTYLSFGRKSKIIFGERLRINSDLRSNPIGRSNGTSIVVEGEAVLKIGDDVGISNSAIFCRRSIEIGNRTLIGGNCVIYDTDFHSLHSETRKIKDLDGHNSNSKSVKIGDDVFIGAHTTILKGVIVGNKSIIGAGSVVTKNIPPGEIWAGNPAKYISKAE